MTCDYCKREDCRAYATVTRGGIEWPALHGDERIEAERDCREATRVRAERAEAVIADAVAVAERWASIGWRDAPMGDAAYASGANAAGEAILSEIGKMGVK